MADLNLLTSIGTVSQFKKDEIIFQENEIGKNMYIVLKGSLGVFVNSFVDFPVRVAQIGQGSFFGEMSLIDGEPRSVTLLTESECTLLLISKNKFELLLEKSPDIANNIVSTLCDRADSTAKTAREMGKYVPPIQKISCAELKDLEVQQKIVLMTSIAQQIRRINTMLYDSERTELGDNPNVSQLGIVTLFPDGYKPFNIVDSNDNSKMLQEKKVDCPYCREESNAFVPLATNKVENELGLSGRIIYKDFDILLYTNVVCPNCNYTDTYREFCKYRPPLKNMTYYGNQFKYKENFTGFVNTHNHTVDEAILSYYLNIKCLGKVPYDPLRFAKAWIRLHWIYSDLNQTDFAKQAAEKAIENYGTYLDMYGKHMNVMDLIRIHGILAELSAAVEDKTAALKYFQEITIIGKNRTMAREMVQQSLRRYKELKGTNCVHPQGIN